MLVCIAVAHLALLLLVVALARAAKRGDQAMLWLRHAQSNDWESSGGFLDPTGVTAQRSQHGAASCAASGRRALLGVRLQLWSGVAQDAAAVKLTGSHAGSGNRPGSRVIPERLSRSRRSHAEPRQLCSPPLRLASVGNQRSPRQ